MIESGWILYLLLFALLYLFWRQVRGSSFADWLERAEREHEHVRRLHAAHPTGGDWREVQRWMREIERHGIRRKRR